MSGFSFKIFANDRESNARAGVIHTCHGDIKTPSFVPVGTQATVKAVSNEDLYLLGTQAFFVNTYHLYLRPGVEIIKKFNGLHNFIGWKKPLMTDSAGFQIFSLAMGSKRIKNPSFAKATAGELELRIKDGKEETVPLVKIDDNGVEFRSHIDGSKHLFTPEKSIDIQKDLGADIMIAFDECTYYPSSHDYADKAMQRTHRWALRCLTAAQGKLQGSQALYGVIQGGVFEDLRKESAKFISSLPFEGIAIGGVSVGESKREMQDVLDWVVPNLPKEKPRHLLGVGEIDDIFALIERGIDTFDCVVPTRLARMGQVLVKSSKLKVKSLWTIDIAKEDFAKDKKPIDEKCHCFVCQKYNRAYLHHLFRAKELTVYRLLTFHNLFFIEQLISSIRYSIKEGSFIKLKKEWL